MNATLSAIVCLALAIATAAAPLRPQLRRTTTAAGGHPTRIGDARLRRARRRTPAAREVAAWCDDIARRVRSGSTLRDAVMAIPAGPATERATEPVRLAIDRGAALADAIARIEADGPHLRLALGVIATASRIGGPAAASIDRTAIVLRQRATDLDERATQAAQARLSSQVMTAVPLSMLAVLVATDDDVRSVVASPVGACCVGLGLTLNAAGWWWIRRTLRVPS